MIIGLEHASTARSHSRSGSRSPALAKPMMALAIASRGGSTTPQLCRAWMANSNEMPKRRVVSRSNLSPVKIFSDRHVKNSSRARGFQNSSDGSICRSGTRPKHPGYSCCFLSQEGPLPTRMRQPQIAPILSRDDFTCRRADDEDKKHAVNHRSHEPAEMGGIGHRDTACHPDDHKKKQRRPLQRQPAGPVWNRRQQKSCEDGRDVTEQHFMRVPVTR